MVAPGATYGLRVLLLASLYFAAGKLSLRVGLDHGSVSPVWPAAGLALAALYRGGNLYWPGVALGAFLIPLSLGQGILVCLGIALGNTLAAVLGVELLRRTDFQPALERLTDVARLVLLAALAATTVSATIGAASLALGDPRAPAFVPTWWTWWLGDAVGVLILAPVLLTWSWQERPPFRMLAEAGVLLAVLLLGSLILFVQPIGDVSYSLAFVVFALVMWSAVRFGPRGAALASLVVAVIAVWDALAGIGPFRQRSPRDSLVMLHAFLVMLSVTALAVAAALAERRQAERSRGRYELQFRRLWEKSADGMRLLDAAGTVLRVNDAFCRMVQKPEAELVGHLFTVIYREDQRAPAMVRFQESLRQGQVPDYFERELVLWNGGTLWLEHSNTLLDEEGEAPLVLSLCKDVTERKQAEEALRRSEERYRSLFEANPQPMYVFDWETLRILAVNAAAVDKYGWTREELLKMSILDIRRPEDVPELMQHFDDGPPVIGHSGVRKHRKKDGTIFDAEILAHDIYFGKRRARFAMVIDVTERVRGEETVRQSRQQYQELVHAIDGIVWEGDAGTFRFTFVSPQAERILGYPLSCWLNEPDFWLKHLHPDDRDWVTRFCLKETQEGREHQVEYRMIAADGRTVWLRDTVSVSPQGGKVRGLMTEITTRKQAEDAVRASEAKYRSLVENLEQQVFLKDADMCFVAANGPFCKSVGRGEAEIVGRTDFEIYPRRLAEKYRGDDLRVLEDGQRVEVEENTLIDAQPRTVRVVKTPVKDDQGKIVGVLGIRWDVTEQRALEAHLRQTQKMEAVGQLAGGVAHDFNNLLTAILGNLSLVLGGSQLAGGDRELLLSAEIAGQRAAELTRQLLGFSRRSPMRPMPLNLGAAVEETIAIMRHSLDPRIQLEIDIAPDLWTVLADAGQMTQVLVNLCLNARDAMPQGGRLQIVADNWVLGDQDNPPPIPAVDGEVARLRISDSGVGIAPENLGKIFEPFFTTKDPGKGTGLGLAMVFGIIQQHKGWIECASEVGRGTRFDIYLPRCRDALPAASADGAGIIPGSETILLVDDEAMIRNLGKTILEKHGYQVLLAENGKDAVTFYRRDQNRIDLVLLDLTMPEMSGRETLAHLKQVDGGVRVLYMSGYSSDQLSESSMSGALGFLSKPFSPKQLAETVRKTLDLVKALAQP